MNRIHTTASKHQIKHEMSERINNSNQINSNQINLNPTNPNPIDMNDNNKIRSNSIKLIQIQIQT